MRKGETESFILYAINREDEFHWRRCSFSLIELWIRKSCSTFVLDGVQHTYAAEIVSIILAHNSTPFNVRLHTLVTGQLARITISNTLYNSPLLRNELPERSALLRSSRIRFLEKNKKINNRERKKENGHDSISPEVQTIRSTIA